MGTLERPRLPGFVDDFLYGISRTSRSRETGRWSTERNGVATCTRAEVGEWVARTAARYDVAFCDPPYDFTDWDSLLASLPADLAVLESRDVIEPPEGWTVLRSKHYGGTIVTVIRPVRVAEKGRS